MAHTRRFALAGLLVVLLAWLAPAAHGAAGSKVSGTVSGSDQGFLPGAVVALDGPAHHEAKTDADGRFTLTDVARGRYRVRVTADGYLPIDNPMEVGTAPVSVDIVLLRLPGLP